MKTAPLFLLLSLALASAAEPPLTDNFDADNNAIRRATRGPWKFQDGMASCTQDDALYKQFKDHGPVIWYDLDFTDGRVGFSMKPDEKVQTFVFTINGADGHVFRFVTREGGTFIKAFPLPGQPDGALDREGPGLKPGAWTPVEVVFAGEKATVKIGDYEKTVTHPAIAQPKTTIGLGFSFGTMEFEYLTVN